MSMGDSSTLLPSDDEFQQQLSTMFRKGHRNKFGRFLMAALGSIPWVGGLIAGMGNMSAEIEQGKANDVFRSWFEIHRERIEALGQTIFEITERLEQLGPQIEERIQSDEYITLVRKAFRAWDAADTTEKRRLVQNLLGNAAGSDICTDDVVRLFIEWIDYYHETHFKVIAEIFHHPGVTRGEIWENIYGRSVRENSAEADLFKLLVRDLSTGGVIRQHRETTPDGQFIKKSPGRTRHRSVITKSAFDDTEQYELTELGRQFVHYSMTEIVPRVASEGPHNP